MLNETFKDRMAFLMLKNQRTENKTGLKFNKTTNHLISSSEKKTPTEDII